MIHNPSGLQSILRQTRTLAVGEASDPYDVKPGRVASVVRTTGSTYRLTVTTTVGDATTTRDRFFPSLGNVLAALLRLK